MSRPHSQWHVTASCDACGGPFKASSTAVLVRHTWLGERGVVLDALGERWPSPGRLLHPACFAADFGRRALWVAFAAGRVDKGGVIRSQADVPDVPGWTLTVGCCECGAPLDAARAALVREPHREWAWAPVLAERRPGAPQVCHLSCFVRVHGRARAYLPLGRVVWKEIGPLVNAAGNIINP